MGEKSAQNLLDEIAASKKNSLARLIYAIGMPFVGERTAQLLAEHFGSMDKLAEASPEELMEVGEVGPKIAEGVREFFSESANRKLIELLRAVGVNMKEARPRVEGYELCRDDVCLHRDAGTPVARRSGGFGSGARRQGGVVGKQKDKLRGGGRQIPGRSSRRRSRWALPSSTRRNSINC